MTDVEALSVAYAKLAREDIVKYGITSFAAAMKRCYALAPGFENDDAFQHFFPTMYDIEALTYRQDAGATEHKTESNLCLASYNITATFFTDNKPYSQYYWTQRKDHVVNAMREANVDAMALQEIAPEQAIDLMEMLPEYRFVFFTQAQTAEVDAGKVYTSQKEVKANLVDKFIGTALIGIMYDPRKLQAIHSGIFWYHPEPFTVPTATDRSETDKGFNNMNTPRGPGFVRFMHLQTQKDFYFFSSHAPISGGYETRAACFALERTVIDRLVGKLPWFSVGDRNMFPDEGHSTMYETLLNGSNVYDWKHSTNHVGHGTTWLGYLYEPLKFQTQVLENGKFDPVVDQARLDVGIGSLQSVWSAHYHCVIRGEQVELLGDLSPEDNETRNFASDHSMLVAKFVL